MLAALRKGTSGILAKAFIGLLVLSFAVWGISDIFSGYSRHSVATVGEVEISPQEFQRDLQLQMRRFSSRLNRSLTLDEARALGLDRQVLNALINRAALQNLARELNLGIADTAIAQRLMKEPSFQDSSGRFSRAIFEQLIRANGMNEAMFLLRQRSAYVQDQITGTIAGNLPVPGTLIKAENIYRNQTRTLKYFTLTLDHIEAVGEPSAEDLQKFHEGNKAKYSTPELRKLGVIALVPDEVAKKIDIAESELKAYYEANQAAFHKPERRTIQQIPFPDVKAAQAAYEKIQAGASFEEVAKENKVTDEDLNLGTLSKAEMLDPVVADVAFSLAANEVSKPVEGQLSTVLLRVTKIEPERVTPFEEAKDQIRRKLARERAIQEISDLYGKIEDERAAGTPLEEIAKQLGLPYRIIPAVDRQGKDADGKDIDPPLPEQFRVLSEAFVSDVGLEADPVETQDQGLVWFDVLEIYPPKVRPLAEIRDRVAADWKETEQRARLGARARALVERLRKGEDIGTVAQELGLEAKESKPLKRSDSTDELPATAVTQAFALQKGSYGSASSQEGKARVVFQVIGIKDPDPLSREAAEALEKSLQPQLAGDLLEQFVSGLTREYGVTRNQQLIDELTGASRAGGQLGSAGSY